MTDMTDWHDYTASGAPHTVCTSLKVRRGVWSPQLGNRRDILVSLPGGYADGDRRFPVAYMHDGQNLFDQASSFSGEWMADETQARLCAEGLELILVGLPNSGAARTEEYSPFDDPEYGGGSADAYLRFVVETVKPLIDRDFRTLAGREHTAIIGSSMGGLLSLYAFFQPGAVFGHSGVLSPALWFADGAILGHVRAAPFAPGNIYLDIGASEGDTHVSNTRALGELLLARGYRLNETLCYHEEPGAPHSESAWALRLDDVLRFFFGRQPAPTPEASDGLR